mmetsp:Transcript_31608/g.46106  ORF Transcript_31608/g.46106 Transcript_31608/m.46106 type:complete len:233 (-) Transcript_31608:932-1630(-)
MSVSASIASNSGGLMFAALARIFAIDVSGRACLACASVTSAPASNSIAVSELFSNEPKLNGSKSTSRGASPLLFFVLTNLAANDWSTMSKHIGFGCSLICVLAQPAMTGPRNRATSKVPFLLTRTILPCRQQSDIWRRTLSLVASLDTKEASSVIRCSAPKCFRRSSARSCSVRCVAFFEMEEFKIFSVLKFAAMTIPVMLFRGNDSIFENFCCGNISFKVFLAACIVLFGL